MSSFAQRNAHFDRLFATNKLFWLGQKNDPRALQAIEEILKQ